jgi:hypothetical protein
LEIFQISLDKHLLEPHPVLIAYDSRGEHNPNDGPFEIYHGLKQVAGATNEKMPQEQQQSIRSEKRLDMVAQVARRRGKDSQLPRTLDAEEAGL